MISKNKMLLVSTIQIKTDKTYQENLEKILFIVKNSESELIVAPELSLTDFDYEHFEEVAAFYHKALEQLLDVVSSKILVLTMTRKVDNKFFNQAIVIHNHKVIHRQNKYKLFTLGEERKFFKAGEKEKIVPFSINGISYGILICFELRFKELWRQLEEVDILLIPARWGKPRKNHLEILSQALAIMNQAFVIVSNSADSDMASSSAIISPWGDSYMNDSLEELKQLINLKDLKKSRRMINMK